MASRKAIRPKIRFEVFKRDSFTCQYCGRKAPDVVLEVDHIKPVAKGGNNSLLNLVTSCVECNRGKGKEELSENSAVEVQRRELELRNERRLQLEMMLEWAQGLRDQHRKEYQQIAELFEEESGLELGEKHQKAIKKAIRDFGFCLAYEAAEIAVIQYIRYGRWYTLDEAAEKLGGICYNIKHRR